MKVFVTGYRGKIGKYLIRHGYRQFTANVTDLNSVSSFLKRNVKRDEEFTVMHLAAKSDVAWCEENKDEAFLVNVLGTKNVLDALGRYPHSKFINFSTCHVFSGTKYWAYSEKHKPSPVNWYGQTKMISEGVTNLATYDAVSIRIGKILTVEDISAIRGLSPEDSVPNFIHRNYVPVLRFIEIVDALSKTRFSEFPFIKNYGRLLHVGGDENWSMYQMWNFIREQIDLPEIKPRTRELPGYAPRPFRCKLNVNEMKKILK